VCPPSYFACRQSWHSPDSTTLLDIPVSLVAQSITGQRQLTALPPNFSFFTALVDLDLSKGGLETIGSIAPSLRYLTSLKKLNLSANAISELPREIGLLKSLTDLDASSNALTVLPEELGNLTDLVFLNLMNNQVGRWVVLTVHSDVGGFGSAKHTHGRACAVGQTS
jgi:Leucine-rich repeat (LRR) protein